MHVMKSQCQEVNLPRSTGEQRMLLDYPVSGIHIRVVSISQGFRVCGNSISVIYSVMYCISACLTRVWFGSASACFSFVCLLFLSTVNKTVTKLICECVLRASCARPCRHTKLHGCI